MFEKIAKYMSLASSENMASTVNGIITILFVIVLFVTFDDVDFFQAEILCLINKSYLVTLTALYYSYTILIASTPFLSSLSKIR